MEFNKQNIIDIKALFTEISNLAIDISMNTKTDVVVEYSGVLHKINVLIYRDGWSLNNYEPSLEEEFRICPHVRNHTIQKLAETKKILKYIKSQGG